MNPRQQGDIGERAAAAWLLTKDAIVAYPFGHSPDWDLVAEIELKMYRVQVKTATCFRKGRWVVALCTRGGNRSWSGVVKTMDATRCDYLFVLVGDGRQWFIPTVHLGGGSGLLLGGPKYARFEIEPGPAIFEYERRIAARSRLFAHARGDVRVAKGDAL